MTSDRQTNMYEVTRTVKMTKKIEAESAEEAKEFFSESDAQTQTKTIAEVIRDE